MVGIILIRHRFNIKNAISILCLIFNYNNNNNDNKDTYDKITYRI